MNEFAYNTKLGINPWNDFAFKKVFGQPANAICLISLLNAILTLDSPVCEVEILNPFNEKDFEEDKLSCVDVSAKDANGRIFVVEIQLSVAGGYLSRAVFYACEAYVGQLSSGDEYDLLRATYGISLLVNPVWRHNSQLHHRFQLVDQASGISLKDAIEIHTVELSKYHFDGRTPISQMDHLSQWMYWMLHAPEYSASDLKQVLPDAAFMMATDTLQQIRERTKDKLMYDARQKAIRDRAWELKSAVAESKDQGIALGREQGIALGEERGKELGKELGLAQGTEIGIEVGKELGRLNTLEELLGLDLTDDQSARAVGVDALRAKVADLKTRLRNRP